MSLTVGALGAVVRQTRTSPYHRSKLMFEPLTHLKFANALRRSSQRYDAAPAAVLVLSMGHVCCASELNRELT